MLPVWQKLVEPEIEAGRMVAIGVVQEQHPERTRLYRQWRELQWPIFVDSMNVLDIEVVPIPMAIDEWGVVRFPRASPRNFVSEFLDKEFVKVDIPEGYNRAEKPDVAALESKARQSASAGAWSELGAAYFNHGSDKDLDRSIAALERAIEVDPSDGRAHFRLGAALRRRYENQPGHGADAQRAIRQWGLALAENPNQYIWRRRLQQYGPRLDKPYNFYFWVAQARKEIAARGETPVKLEVEPMGSELAAPSRGGSEPVRSEIANPDPEGKINRDGKSLVQIDSMVTPARVRPGHRVRARVVLRPNPASRPWWNNEADDLAMWVGLGEQLRLGEGQLAYPNPQEPETREPRVLEFELAVDEDAPDGEIKIPAYALYYVCEDSGGLCYYLRQEFSLSFVVDRKAPSLK